MSDLTQGGHLAICVWMAAALFAPPYSLRGDVTLIALVRKYVLKYSCFSCHELLPHNRYRLRYTYNTVRLYSRVGEQGRGGYPARGGHSKLTFAQLWNTAPSARTVKLEEVVPQESTQGGKRIKIWYSQRTSRQNRVVGVSCQNEHTPVSCTRSGVWSYIINTTFYSNNLISIIFCVLDLFFKINSSRSTVRFH